MLFNSIEFFYFFFFTTLVYFLLPLKGRQLLLLLSSCGFYMAFIPKYILILLATILVDYFAGIFIVEARTQQRKKIWLWVSIVTTCLILFVFKYFNFFRDSVEPICRFFGISWAIPAMHLVLPIGLSFHTFQSLSYVIEVYRGRQTVERNFLVYALYVMFYPQLVAGPIERPQNILHQFYEKHPVDFQRIASGLKVMAWGFFKKVVIADHLVIVVDQVYGSPGSYTGPMLLMASVFFAFQIYCDFSGYSDIAIGAARVLGFQLMTNFDRPYSSRSISEFWRRWHISLSTWFKDYLYIPLGGSKAGEWMTARNLMITFTVSGLWHGASVTYIVWGALNGLYLVLGRFKQRFLGPYVPHLKMPYACASLITFTLITFSWIFFRARSMQDAWTVIRRLPIGWDNVISSFSSVAPMTVGIGAFLIALLLLVERYLTPESIPKILMHRSIGLRWSAYAGIVLSIYLFWTADKTQFIYFQF